MRVKCTSNEWPSGRLPLSALYRGKFIDVGQAPTPSRFFKKSLSEHADGERRGPVPFGRHLKTRLSETFPTLPSDSI